MDEVWLVRSTFTGKDEAISAAEILLAERLIACANISAPVTSLYRWQGVLQREQETVLWLKTVEGKVDAVIARLLAIHPYRLPAIVAWPMARANAAFSEWVRAETA